MAKKLKRAFTIVELVIVIAVIAILAAVLIPTFTTLIDKANQSADTSNVKNMNSILSMDETTNGKPKTMDDAVKVIREGGYDLEKLTPTGQGYDIVWDQDANRLLMVNGNEVIFGETEKNANEKHLWVVVDSAEKIEATGYSVYLTDVFEGKVEVKQGVDVGSNKDITEIKYTTSDEQDVTIRTNGGALVVNAAAATVSHYGAAASVDIQAVADHSYHEYGTVAGNITLKQGRFVAEDNASAAAVIVTATDVKAVEIVINDTTKTWSIAAEDDTVSEGLAGIVSGNKANAEIAVSPVMTGFAGGVGTESSPYQIATAEHLSNISLFSNEMKNGNGYYFKQVANIDAAGISPIEYFSGTYDGDNYELIACPDSIIFNIGRGEIVLKNIQFKQTSKMGVLLFYTSTGSTRYENIIVSALDTTQKYTLPIYGSSTFCLQAYGYTEFINCINELSYFAPASGTENYAGVFVGNYPKSGSAYALVFENCVNRGIISGGKVGFFMGQNNGAKLEIVENKEDIITTDKSKVQLYVSNCKNEGTIVGTEICKPISVSSEGLLSQVAEINDYLMNTPQAFLPGTMVEGGINGTLSLSGTNVQVSIPEEDISSVAYVEVAFTVSTSYQNAKGEGMGSFYFKVIERVSVSELATHEFAYVSKIVSSATYGEAAYEAIAGEEKVSAYGQKYKVVDGDDGYKTVVVNYQSLLENYDSGAASCQIGTYPSYSLALYNSDNTVVGTTPYVAKELEK